MRYIDLFAGIGGFRYGLEKVGKHLSIGRSSGDNIRPNGGKSNNSFRKKRGNSKYAFNCVYTNEWDKYAAQIYKKHYGECDTTDITKVNEKDIPDFDLLCAGFPCQSFSIAGKRKGFEDTRGTLFFDIARIASHKRPRHLLLENVKGLLSHDKGKTFQTILGVLSDLGYRTEWQVLNSKHFGVPQNRERVFIIGHLGRGSGRKIFPIGQGNQEFNVPDAQGNDIAHTLQTGDKHRGSYVLNQQTRSPDRPSLKYSSEGSGPLFKKDEAFCLPTSGGSGQYLMKPKIRRLTPVECERLQGFPDGWTEGISDTQRYKCLGNAVTTNVITEIGKKLALN